MLTVRDHMALQIAFTRYRYLGARDADILERLGWSAVAWSSRVNALIDEPEALAAYPMEVRRLQRLRAQRRRARAS